MNPNSPQIGHSECLCGGALAVQERQRANSVVLPLLTTFPREPRFRELTTIRESPKAPPKSRTFRTGEQQRRVSSSSCERWRHALSDPHAWLPERIPDHNKTAAQVGGSVVVARPDAVAPARHGESAATADAPRRMAARGRLRRGTQAPARPLAAPRGLIEHNMSAL